MPEPLAPKTFHHLALPTSDPEVSTRFYKNVLGLLPIPRPNFTFGGAWLYHPGSQLQVHLIAHDSAPGPGRPIDTLAQHMALEVADLDVAEQCLKDHGIEYHRQVNAGGFQQIFFHDPDGNLVEVGVYPANRQGGALPSEGT